jgi:hypothetical protein
VHPCAFVKQFKTHGEMDTEGKLLGVVSVPWALTTAARRASPKNLEYMVQWSGVREAVSGQEDSEVRTEFRLLYDSDFYTKSQHQGFHTTPLTGQVRQDLCLSIHFVSPSACTLMLLTKIQTTVDFEPEKV